MYPIHAAQNIALLCIKVDFIWLAAGKVINLI